MIELTPEVLAGTSADDGAVDHACVDDTAQERAALDVPATTRYTIDAGYAVGKALSTFVRVRSYRPRLARLPPEEFDVTRYDRLPVYARALRCLNGELTRRVKVLSGVPALTAEGQELRDTMLEYASLLSRKKLVEPELIVLVREGSGTRDTAEDLVVLEQELRALPPGWIAESGTAVTTGELRRAATLAHEIQLRVGNGAELDLTQKQLADERRKLGHLLLKAQDEVRRGMTFLRWREGDAAVLVPSLYTPGGGRRPERPAEVAPPEDEAEALDAAPEEPEGPLGPEDYPFVREEE